MNKGDFMQVTEAQLRTAPWRRTATWINKYNEPMSAADMIYRAGLDWTVSKSPLYAQVLTPNGVSQVECEKVATTRVNRDNSATVLGIVSNSYKVLQNVEIVDLIDTITYEAGATYDSAGELLGGKRIFVAAKMPDTVQIAGLDPVDTYLVATNGHDGLQALEIQIKHLRLICTNGMTGFRNYRSVKLKHTRRMEGRVEQARQTLGLVYAESHEFRKFAEELYATTVTDNMFWNIVSNVFPIDEDESKRGTTVAQARRESVMDIWRGPTQENIHGTAWGAYQAFIEYSEWSRGTRGAENVDFRRAERSMVGTQDAVVNRALELILA